MCFSANVVVQQLQQNGRELKCDTSKIDWYTYLPVCAAQNKSNRCQTNMTVLSKVQVEREWEKELEMMASHVSHV